MQRVFVGDVQGCAQELETLVERARAELGSDFELWFAGDLVNRGPDNLEVLRRVRALHDGGRARVVLGNHDVFLVAAHLGLASPGARDTVGDVLHCPDANDWIVWLRSLPLVESGRIGGDRFALVHASVHPDWSLDELHDRTRAVQARLGAPDPREARDLLLADARLDPDRDLLERLTRARSVDSRGAWSDEVPIPPWEPWHRRWSRRNHDYGVVYGHWALQRLHVAPGLRGLDTGCVHHGRGTAGFLTAWLPDVPRVRPHERLASAFAIPDDRFWHVPAHRRYDPRAPEERAEKIASLGESPD